MGDHCCDILFWSVDGHLVTKRMDELSMKTQGLGHELRT